MTDNRTLQKDLIDHPVMAYINSLTSAHSKRTMLSALKSVIAVELETDPARVDPSNIFAARWGSFTVERFVALRSLLLERYSRRHANKLLSAVRGVLRYCYKAEPPLISERQWGLIREEKGIVVKSDQRAGRLISIGEIDAIARACADDESPAGARDDTIIGLGYLQGPRISEFSNLNLEDYDPKTGDLTIREAKGGKTRTIRANNSSKESLDEWIQFRGKDPGALFNPVSRTGSISSGDPISTTGIAKMFGKRANEAGVKPFTCHDLRRTFITNNNRINDIKTSQLIAGHESIETTAAYDRRSIDEALEDSAKLHYPSYRHLEGKRA